MQPQPSVPTPQVFKSPDKNGVRAPAQVTTPLNRLNLFKCKPGRILTKRIATFDNARQTNESSMTFEKQTERKKRGRKKKELHEYKEQIESRISELRHKLSSGKDEDGLSFSTSAKH